jgi:hypothetical protein
MEMIQEWLDEVMLHESVGANLGQTDERARSRSERRHRCGADAQGGQTGQGDRSDWFADEEWRSPTNARPEGPRQGWHT